MPVCDTCRKRKIRCDRDVPCASCKSSKFECTSTPKKPRAARKSGLTPRQNEVPTVAIRPKDISFPDTPRKYDGAHAIDTRVSKHAADASQPSSDLNEVPSVSLIDSETMEREGGSSLDVHSVAARDLLVQTLGNHAQVRNNPKMITALGSLRQIVEADKAEVSQSQKPKLNGLSRPRQLLYELKLPPTEGVLNILRKSKERTTFVFSPPLSFIPRDQFYDFCKTVFFRTEDYPTSTAVIVHGVLGNLIEEFEWIEDDPILKEQYHEWVLLCRSNVEIGIANLDLLLPASMENAQALCFAASHCMGLGQASICKKLATHGCMVVQSLGWHRSSSIKNDPESLQRQKLVIFWMLYTIDRNLSLRLGQPSLIQDDDIDHSSSPTESVVPLASLGQLKVWVDSARVQGLIYQQLYSPGSLRQTDSVRFESVQRLLELVETTRPKKGDISRFVQGADFVPADYFYNITDLVCMSDEVMYHALLCMVYRATPASAKPVYDPAVECIKHARAALDCHRQCTTGLKGQTDLFESYLHWTILNTPFVPFTTLFSHVLTSHDQADLERLQLFAESMSGCHTSRPAQKVFKLASVFVSIATIYVESREQEAHNTRAKPLESMASVVQNDAGTGTGIYQQTTNWQIPAWTPFNPFLDALGFADDPALSMSMDGVSATANLENWFNGNQQIMGFLEDDLSYLDTTALEF